MKLGQKICTNDILDKFEKGSGWLKNIAARGQCIFPYMAVYGYQGSYFPATSIGLDINGEKVSENLYPKS